MKVLKKDPTRHVTIIKVDLRLSVLKSLHVNLVNLGFSNCSFLRLTPWSSSGHYDSEGVSRAQ